MEWLLVFFLFGLAAGIPTVPAHTEHAVPVFGIIDRIAINNMKGEAIPFVIDAVSANEYMLKSGSLRHLLNNPVVLLIKDSDEFGRATFFMAYDGLGGNMPKEVNDAFRSSKMLPVVFFPPNLPSKDMVGGFEIDRYQSSRAVQFAEFSDVGSNFKSLPWVVLFPKAMADVSLKGKLKEIGSFDVGADQMRVIKDSADMDIIRDVQPEPTDSGVHLGPFGYFNFGDFIGVPVKFIRGGLNILVGMFNGSQSTPYSGPFSKPAAVVPAVVPVAVDNPSVAPVGDISIPKVE